MVMFALSNTPFWVTWITAVFIGFMIWCFTMLCIFLINKQQTKKTRRKK